MHRCLVQTDALTAEQIILGREESRHLQTVLRVREGETVELFDGAGLTRRVAVRAVSRSGLTFAPLEAPVAHPRLPVEVTLFASVIKRMDWTIEKAAELGVARIVPVLTERSVIRIAPDAREGKAERWRRIAEDSVRQCDGAWLPEILPPVTFAESLPRLATGQPVFVAALSPSARPFREALAAHSAHLAQTGYFVGPEGDFTPDELERLLDAGTIPVSLGPRILRAETAALYGLSLLNATYFFL